MKKKSNPPDSLAKRVIDRVAGRISGTTEKKPTTRRLETENLEPRVLFSGSPVAPVDVPLNDQPSELAHEASPSPVGTTSTNQADTQSLIYRSPSILLTPEEIGAIRSLSGDSAEKDESSREVEVERIASETFVTINEQYESKSVQFQTDIDEAAAANLPDALSTVTEADLASEVFMLDQDSILESDLDYPVVEIDVEATESAAFFSAVALGGLIQGRSSFQHTGSIRSRRPDSEDNLESSTLTIHNELDVVFESTTGVSTSEGATDSPVEDFEVSGCFTINEADPKKADPDSVIHVGGYSNRKNARESDRLYIEISPAIDFTTFPSGKYHELVASADPILYSSIDSDEARPLTGSLSGSTFEGENFSIELWLKADHTTGAQHLLSISDESGQKPVLSLELDDRSILFNHRTKEVPDQDYGLTILDAVRKNTWHHLAVTRDSNGVSIFVDGKNRSRGATISGVSIFGPEVLFSENEDSGFNGTLCEFALYGSALNERTVLSHYHTGFTSGLFNNKGGSRSSKKKTQPILVDGANLICRQTSDSSSEIESFEIVENLLDRAADLTTESELGVFITSSSNFSRAEIAEIDWASTEEVLEQSGAVERLPRQKANHSRSIFISRGSAGADAAGFVTDLDEIGEIRKVTPLNFDDLDADDIISAIKAASIQRSGWSSEEDDPEADSSNNLRRVSSVQSDVFGFDF